MLKLQYKLRKNRPRNAQPPSGGCVLKHVGFRRNSPMRNPAAFGRLCVETTQVVCLLTFKAPAAFGRLCVETAPPHISPPAVAQPPSGGCVLKPTMITGLRACNGPSRLRAAVC